MTSKFFRLVLSALLLGVSAVAAQTVAPAQGAATTPEAEEKKPKQGYVRLWNMMPTEVGEFQVLQEKGSPESAVLLSAEPMNLYADYVPLKPGRYPLKIVRAADPKTALKTFDVILKADVFVTFFVRTVDGQLSIEMLDDTYDPEKALTGKLVVRHYVRDAAVTVKCAALPRPTALGYGEERTLENLPLKPLVFQMEAKMPNGQVKNWASEVDFRATRHASLFLVLDVYGRFRPRTSADGQAEVAATPGR